jgi:homoserine kinase
VVIERQRQSLIPGFADIRAAAMAKGALGCSISGAGPTIFAWALEGQADDVLTSMKAALTVEGDAWIIDIESPGARLVDA